jgi:hypothetical protein
LTTACILYHHALKRSKGLVVRRRRLRNPPMRVISLLVCVCVCVCFFERSRAYPSFLPSSMRCPPPIHPSHTLTHTHTHTHTHRPPPSSGPSPNLLTSSSGKKSVPPSEGEPN